MSASDDCCKDGVVKVTGGGCCCCDGTSTSTVEDLNVNTTDEIIDLEDLDSVLDCGCECEADAGSGADGGHWAGGMTIIDTEAAPAAIGPYSQAIRADNFLFTSGQIPLDPQTGEIVGDDVETQTVQVLRNLIAILEAAGGSLADVVKANIYLTDLGSFPVLNRIWGEFFKVNPPARACVEVSALPRGVKVEVEAVAYLPVKP